MKITRRRTAISQSMDLFIIIAAVLGVGGVVTASIYNLVNSATTNSSVSVVGASFKAGSNAASSPVAISISIKNNGGSPINCSSTTSCEVVLAGTSTGSTAASCNLPCTLTSGGSLGWTVASTTGPLTFDLASAPAALPSGAQTSFVLSGPLAAGTSPTFWAPGDVVTVNVLFGSASAQVTVISE